MKSIRALALLFCLSSLANAQMGGFDLSTIIPPIPIPPKIEVTSPAQGAALPPGQDVTVQAKITTFATVKPDGTYLSTPNLVLAKLCVSTDYKTASVPNWSCSDMTIGSPTTQTSPVPSKVYNVSGVIQAKPEGTEVTYAIQAADDYANSDAGMGASQATMQMSPASGVQVGSTFPPSSTFKGGETCSPAPNSSCADETRSYVAQGINPVPMQNDFDVLDLYVGSGGTSTKFFTVRARVQGVVRGPAGSFDGAPAYVVAIVNMERPPQPAATNDCDKARGVYAALWFPDVSATAGVIPSNPVLVDAEATCKYVEANPDSVKILPEGQPKAQRPPGDPTGILTLRTDVNNLKVTATTTDPLYDKSYVVTALTAQLAGSIENIQFTIFDVANATRFYPTNRSFKFQSCTTDCPRWVTVSGNVTAPDGSPLTGTLTVTKSTGESVPNGTQGFSGSFSLQNVVEAGGSYELKFSSTGYFQAVVSLDLTQKQPGESVPTNVVMFTPERGGDITSASGSSDGRIDRNDLDALLQRFGQAVSSNQQDPILQKADLDSDGKVTIKDLAILLRHYNRAASP